ncbi:MAG: hypothetical protein ACQEP9_05895, partial [Bacillota bacterium]
PGGLQHPNGDSLKVADMYSKSGGREIQIYLQGVYPDWPYDVKNEDDIEDYIAKIEPAIKQIASASNQELFVYIPFNEPDAIWYNIDDKKEEFFQDWQVVYEKILEIDPQASIAGPNNSYYDQQFYADFMEFCQENDCLPDVVTWHELDNHFYVDWYQHYNSYREIEANLGIEPREITINEYGTFMDLSVPGQLIQWLARFEATKVDACLAYWHDAGSLDDLVVENNKVTGAWWLYKWYSDLTGQTVKVIPPAKNKAGLQGIASLDNNKEEVRLLFGGASGETKITINGFADLDCFNNQVQVEVISTAWTGQKGAATGASLELKRNYKIVDGQVEVELSDLDMATAYQLRISSEQNSINSAQETSWKSSYGAERAKITNASIFSGGYFDGKKLYNPNQNYNSGGQRVGDINRDNSQVEFSVEVPQTGTYRLDIFYSNGHQDLAEQLLQVDDGPGKKIEYPPTIDWNYQAIKTLKLDLQAGTHIISFAKDDNSLEGASLSVELDKIDLTYLAGIDEQESEIMIYREEYNSETTSNDAVISVPDNGYYVVNLNCSNHLDAEESIKLRVNDLELQQQLTRDDKQAIVYLQAGINLVSVASDISINSVELAENRAPLFSWRLERNEASGKQEKSYSFEKINLVEAGDYKMVVYYANAERESGHMYNVDLVDRSAQISVNGTTDQEFYFRNTFSWNNYSTIVIDLELKAGVNTIAFVNDNNYLPKIDQIEIYKGDL